LAPAEQARADSLKRKPSLVLLADGATLVCARVEVGGHFDLMAQ
jgi:hypothetical protein